MHDVSHYTTRNANNYVPYKSSKDYFLNSLFPSTIKVWNGLPIATRESPTLLSFKKLLLPKSISVPKHFYVGERKYSIPLTQMRLKFSDLNYHLFNKNLIDPPDCRSGLGKEDPEHLCFACPRYKEYRGELLSSSAISVHLMLNGSENLNDEKNAELFEIVLSFIQLSKHLLYVMTLRFSAQCAYRVCH